MMVALETIPSPIFHCKKKRFMAQTEQNRVFLGVDVSKDELVTAFRQGGKWSKGKTANTLEAIGAWLRGLGVEGKHFVLEATGPYSERLIWSLSEAGASFSVVSPAQSRAMSKALLKSNKTDDQDAQTLADLGQSLDIRTYSMPHSDQKEQKEVFSALSSLQKQEQQLRNQLHAFEYRVSPSPLAVKALQDVLAAVQAAIAELEQRLAPKQTEAEAAQTVKLLTSIKGVGKVTARAFAAVLGDLKQFGSAKALAKFLGLSPSEFSSGKSVRGARSIAKRGPAKLRALLFNCARSAMRFNPLCAQLYQRLVQKGKNGKVALVAVMHKLARIIFGVAHSQTPFDQNFEPKQQFVPQKLPL